MGPKFYRFLSLQSSLMNCWVLLGVMFKHLSRECNEWSDTEGPKFGAGGKSLTNVGRLDSISYQDLHLHITKLTGM